jgi:FKBP-type peptidyl-prolyl cis-trans isomerase FkpA/FKBP-type peptidyl-prolyl cis-trans isomerase FklB
MSKRTIFIALCLVSAAAWVIAQETLPGGADGPAEDAAAALAQAPPTDARHYSYAIGRDIGSSFHNDGLELDVDSLAAGLRDALAGAKPKYSEELCAVSIQRMYLDRSNKLKERNVAYLAANAKAPGAVVLPSGLQYKVLAEGKGASPKATDMVSVNYVGKFIDGKIFDQSGDTPAEFQVGRVIDGWAEALQKMKVGDKWELVIPAALAYGDAGDDVIPPFSTLVFEVELLGIK